jgi:hypothetical protein
MCLWFWVLMSALPKDRFVERPTRIYHTTPSYMALAWRISRPSASSAAAYRVGTKGGSWLLSIVVLTHEGCCKWLLGLPTGTTNHVLDWNLASCFLLVETVKSLIVKPCPLTLEVFVGLANPGQMGITTWGENVQSLQSIKLIYQLAHGYEWPRSSHE